MKDGKRLALRRWDIVIILIGCLSAAVFFAARAQKPSGSTAVIYQNGEAVLTVELNSVSEAFVYSPVDGVELCIEKDGVTFISSDCPSQTCVKTGKCVRAGDMAVCIPHKTAVVIQGEKKTSSPDVLTY